MLNPGWRNSTKKYSLAVTPKIHEYSSGEWVPPITTKPEGGGLTLPYLANFTSGQKGANLIQTRINLQALVKDFLRCCPLSTTFRILQMTNYVIP